jgi:hypothetical protein
LEISYDNAARIGYGGVDVITWVIKRTLDLIRRGVVIVDISIPSGTGDVPHGYDATVSSVLGREHGRRIQVSGVFVIAECHPISVSCNISRCYTAWHKGTSYKHASVSGTDKEEADPAGC